MAPKLPRWQLPTAKSSTHRDFVIGANGRCMAGFTVAVAIARTDVESRLGARANGGRSPTRNTLEIVAPNRVD